MDIKTRTFEELTKQELYELLQLRAEVFVVEQDCVYQDIDGKDQKALHAIGVKDGKIVAYTRIFNTGDYFSEASIGRVVVRNDYRKDNFGKQIMLASIEVIHDLFNETTIHLSAQTYLKKFYDSLGFEQVGEGYLEDGIPHIGMIKKGD